MIKYFICSLLFLCFSEPTTFKAKVIGVIDGDTIVLLTEDKHQIKVRLEGIDCPESHQDFGTRAKQATAELCFGKDVFVNETGKDQYGRTLGFVYVGDLCVNRELIKMGMAWHYKKYNSDSDLAELEVNAMERKVGLWGHTDPVAPWEWRKSR